MTLLPFLDFRNRLTGSFDRDHYFALTCTSSSLLKSVGWCAMRKSYTSPHKVTWTRCFDNASIEILWTLCIRCICFFDSVQCFDETTPGYGRWERTLNPLQTVACLLCFDLLPGASGRMDEQKGQCRGNIHDSVPVLFSSPCPSSLENKKKQPNIVNILCIQYIQSIQ